MVKHHLKDALETPSKRRRSASLAPPLPARPCDSPSNPFGRKRVRSLVRSLPPPTPFYKHLPLRFQLVRTDRPSPRLHGGVHRVVQVPTNYTFMHLRSLIVFLFGGSCSMLSRGDPHLFEVKRKVELLGMNYKPGQVKGGQTWAKLSSTMDPCRYRPDHKSVDFEEGASSAESTAELFGHTEEEEPGEWKWHAEEDFTLERAWPKGCEPMKAIVYHLDRTTQVHVTINTLPVDKRKGCSNTPYVFSGRGIVALTAPIVAVKGILSKRAARADTGNSPTHSLHSRSLRGSSRSVPSSSKPKPYHRPQSPDQEQNLTDRDAEGETDPDASHFSDYDPWSDDSGGDVSQQRHEPDNDHATFDPDASNRPQAFPRFFSRCQRLARTKLQFGSSFGMEYDLTSSDDEQESDRNSNSPNILHDSSSPVKHHSSPATSLFGSVPPTIKLSKARNTVTPPTQTSSPGPSSPVFSPAFSKPSTSQQPPHFISSPGTIFDTWTNFSPPKKRRHSSFFSHLPFHPSPSGFPKYTPLPARGQLYRMRIKRIEKRVERMKSFEWLKVPDVDEENKKGTKKQEGEAEAKVEGKAMGKGKGKGKGDQMPERRAAPGGVLEMGISRGKRPVPQGTRATRKRCPVDDELEV